jgi:hypothetical protein
MSLGSLSKFRKNVFQIFDEANDFSDLYATSLSFKEFRELVREFSRTSKHGVFTSPNDGSFEEFAKEKGEDVVQLDSEGYVNWEEFDAEALNNASGERKNDI